MIILIPITKTKKLDMWAPRVLTERNLLRRIDEVLLFAFQAFLKRIISGKEKWIVYNNVKHKTFWCNYMN